MPRIQQLGADVVALVRGGVGISSFAGAVAQLVANAIDASLHGARCTVRVDLDVVRGCIRVEDDAAGMSQEDMRLVRWQQHRGVHQQGWQLTGYLLP